MRVFPLGLWAAIAMLAGAVPFNRPSPFDRLRMTKLS
jgi:hypothetical protein